MTDDHNSLEPQAVSHSDADRRHMARALELAARGLYTASPNPRVGCVLVRNGEVIGEGWHQRAGLPHAEIDALQHCHENPAGATAYVTLEPCAHHGRTPPCCDKLIEVGVARVVIASIDPNPLVGGNSIQRLREAGIEVSGGLMADESRQLNCGFFSRMERRRPWVRLKLAASIDGRTALASGESKWITSAPARDDVQHLRARADCILTGAGTVLADNPRMSVRLPDLPLAHRQPLLAIVDSKARTPATATLFDADREVLIFARQSASHQATVIAEHSGTSDGRVCLSGVMRELAQREINEVHVEGGAELAASLLTEQLVDELVLYQAPLLLGSDARPLTALQGFESMQQRIEFEFTDIRTIGRDVRVTLTPRYQQSG